MRLPRSLWYILTLLPYASTTAGLTGMLHLHCAHGQTAGGPPRPSVIAGVVGHPAVGHCVSADRCPTCLQLSTATKSGAPETGAAIGPPTEAPRAVPCGGGIPVLLDCRALPTARAPPVHT